ncbi:MAG: ATP-binding protein [Bacilli bacterium]|jgi:signal transduction histidine kinase/CheY-like chemotaxis protein|nr:ATP-binding protein [Bacilli bacterium]
MRIEEKAKDASKSLKSFLRYVPGNFVFGFFQDGVFFPLSFGKGPLSIPYLTKRSLLAKSGAGFNNLLLKEDRAILKQAYNDVFNDPQKTEDVEVRIQGSNGEHHWIYFSFHRVFEKRGFVVYGGHISDIDARKKKEEEAVKIKQMYDEAAELGKMVIWNYYPDKHLFQLFETGYTEKIRIKFHLPRCVENAPLSILPSIQKEDQDIFLNIFKAIDSGAEHAEGEFRFLFPNSSQPEWERVNMKRIYDEKKHFLGVNCWSQNITENKVAEERYKDALNELDKAYPNSLGSFRLNLSKDICWPSKGPLRPNLLTLKVLKIDDLFLELSKIITDEEIRKEYFRKFSRKKLLNDFKKGITQISLKYPTIRADGLLHYSNGMLFLLRNPNSGDIEGITYALDIDEERKTSLVLDGIVANGFDYVGLIEPSKGTFEFFAKKDWITYAPIGKPIPYEDCCQYIRQQSANPLELMNFKDVETVPAIVNALNTHGPFSLSYTQNRQGTIHCYQLHYSWLSKNDGPILLIRSDITEAYLKDQKQIADLKAAKDEADRANQAKTEFLSRMSHDIRTPLNGIIGMTFLTEEMNLAPEVRDNLEKIDTSSKFLLSLVNDILDMAKAESGHLNLHPEPYPLGEFERYIRAIAEPLCLSRYQTFKFNASALIPGRIPYFDKLRLNQIMFNLISNASKYTPPHGEITFIISEKVCEGDDIALQFEVKDNGIGMSQEFISHLYEPFHQASGSDRAEMRGTGLGLPIIKKLVDAMDGTINVQSELGKGTTFIICFKVPSCVKDIAKEDKNQSIKIEDFARLKGKHVLVCEDNPINQEIVRQIITERGLNVTIVKDGADGLGIFERSSHGYYSLILMDIRMPKIGGIEATEKIRLLPRSDANSVPIIAMTADVFSEDIAKFKNAGMNGYLTKPIEPEKLFQILLSNIS